MYKLKTHIASLFVVMICMVICCFACKNTGVKHGAAIVVDSNQMLQTRMYPLSDSAQIMVDETRAAGDSLSSIRVYTKGLATNFDKTISGIGNIQASLLADVDTNSFMELYVLTRPAYSDPYAKILAYASDENKQIRPILVKDVTDESKAVGGAFAQYNGGDSLYIDGRQLVRKFPVFTLKDSLLQTPIGYQELRYRLVKSADLWQLVVASSVIVRK